MYVAAVSAMAEQNTEVGMLESAKLFINNDPGNNRRSLLDSHRTKDGYTAEFFPWFKKELASSERFALLPDVYDYWLHSFVNATCGCWDVPVLDPADPDNPTTYGQTIGNATGLPLLLEPFALGFNPINSKAELNNQICTQEASGINVDDVSLFEAVDGPWQKLPDGRWEPAGVSAGATPSDMRCMAA